MGKFLVETESNLCHNLKTTIITLQEPQRKDNTAPKYSHTMSAEPCNVIAELLFTEVVVILLNCTSLATILYGTFHFEFKL